MFHQRTTFQFLQKSLSWLSVLALCAYPMMITGAGSCDCGTENVANECSVAKTVTDATEAEASNCCSIAPSDSIAKSSCCSSAESAPAECQCNRKADRCDCQNCQCGHVEPVPKNPPAEPPTESTTVQVHLIVGNLPWQPPYLEASSLLGVSRPRLVPATHRSAQQTCALLSRFTC